MLVTIGYQDRDLTDLVATLRRHGVQELVDVRLHASSRTPGFSKRRLAAALEEAGIAYRHLPALGNPQDNRTGFRVGRPDALARYRAILDGEARDAVAIVADVARERTVALLCLERDAGSCHRRVVADVVLELYPGLSVEHLS